MDNIVGKKSGLTWAVHISMALLVALWLFPTVGLFVSSFRTADQIASSGWWSSLATQERQVPVNSLELREVSGFAHGGDADAPVERVYRSASRINRGFLSVSTAFLPLDRLSLGCWQMKKLHADPRFGYQSAGWIGPSARPFTNWSTYSLPLE